MKQIAKRITFHELLKQPDGTEFTACFTDDVKRGLPPVILKKRSPRNYAERALASVQILGTDRDGGEHAIPNGTASFSVTLGALLESNYGIQSAGEKPENPFDGFPPPQAPRLPVNPEWTDAELAAIQQLATEKGMPPSQVIRQALRAYQEAHRIASESASREVLGTATFDKWGVDLIRAHGGLWLCGVTAENEHFAVALDACGNYGIRDIPPTVSDAALSAFIRNALSSRPHPPVESAAPRSE